MSVLPKELLRRLESDEEIEVVTYRADGTPRAPVPIWVVRVGDAAYVRSWRGAAGGWYRHAQRSGRGTVRAGGREYPVGFRGETDPPREAIDAAYRSKYARYAGNYLPPMLADQAVATTLRVTGT